MLSIILYRCETWTLQVEAGESIFKNKCLRKLLCIYWEHEIKDHVWSKVSIGWQESLLTTINHQERLWFGQVTHSARPSFKALDGRCKWRWQQKSYLTTSKSKQTWKCQNSWEPLPTDHSGGGSLVFLSLGPPDDWSSQRTDAEQVWKRE